MPSVNPFNFQRKVTPHVGYSVHNMSYDKKLTCNPGELIPVYEQEVFPGDSINYNAAFVVKSLPLINPSMIDLDVYVHAWFCPYRLLQSHETIEKGLDTNTFEEYIVGFNEGTTIPYLAVNGEWKVDNPVTSEVRTGPYAYVQVPALSPHPNSSFGLLDYFSIGALYDESVDNLPPAYTHAFMIRAYNAIYNCGYRNATLQCPEYQGVVGSTSQFGFYDGVTVGISLNNTNILRRNWVMDYFTSMLPWQQKGTPIALPITSTLSVDFNLQNIPPKTPFASQTSVSPTTIHNIATDSNTNSGYPLNVVTSSFDINDFRLNNAIQKFMEANARGDVVNFHNYLISHFGTATRDEALSKPLYLGGSKTPILISEVTQTSSSAGSTPQGTLTGKASVFDKNFIFKNRFTEHGIVITLMSIMPKPIYSGGVNRMWIKEDVYSWYSPEFAQLGEQGVFFEELNPITDGDPADNPMEIIGYQGRWSEMRTRQNVATSGFRLKTASSSGNYGGMYDWTIQRQGGRLNSSFIVCKPYMGMFAFPNSKNFIVDFGNIVTMQRPIPALAEPVLIG